MSLLVSIRESDREYARKRAGKAALWNPERLTDISHRAWERAIVRERKARGIRFVETGVLTLLRKRAMAWAENLAVFEPGWSKQDITRRAATETEELEHCVAMEAPCSQVVKYATNPRFRWAFECQGKLSWLRWMVVQEARRANIERAISSIVVEFGMPLLKGGYNLGRIRNLRGETLDLLHEVFA